jgi:hypothetical protein
MRNTAFLLSFLILATGLSGQIVGLPKDSSKTKDKIAKQDYIILNFNWNAWLNGGDKVDVSPFSRGFEIALMYDQPLGKSPFALGFGLGLSTENIFTNALLRSKNDSVDWVSIDKTINPDNTTNREWDRYKLGTTILELPLEVRFRLNPKKRNTFKVTAGFKLGYVVHSKEKYVGPNYLYDKDGQQSNLDQTLSMKTEDLFGINRLRYSVYGRIGYGRFALNFQYGLQPFFESGKGADNVIPIQAGFSFMPF